MSVPAFGPMISSLGTAYLRQSASAGGRLALSFNASRVPSQYYSLLQLVHSRYVSDLKKGVHSPLVCRSGCVSDVGFRLGFRGVTTAQNRAEILYSESHEYVRFVADASAENKCVAAVGISEFAASQLGEIVFVEANRNKVQGQRVARGDPLCTLEAVKAVAELYAPVDGYVLRINPKVIADPQIITRDPEGDGWIAEMTLGRSGQDFTESDIQNLYSSLLSPEAYAAHVRQECDGG